jgi:hypothetical protein
LSAAEQPAVERPAFFAVRSNRLLDAAGQATLGTMKLDIDLTPAQAERLRQEAERLKITPEELARAAVTDLISERDQDFKVAAKRVLEKYNELYRRLA